MACSYATKKTDFSEGVNFVDTNLGKTLLPCFAGSRYFCERLLRPPCRSISKNHATALAFGCPSRPASLVCLPNKGIGDIVTAMTRRDFGQPAFSLRKKRFVKTQALSLLGTTRLLSRSESELLQEMAERYQYNLITRNCVTELFKTINQALLQQNNQGINPSNQAERVKQESTQRLGGTLSTDFNFIPYVSFQSVQDHYNVTASSVINSYRNQQLDMLYARNNGLMNVLRESNTFTSSVYPYNPDDAFFIFFTDDNVTVRPVLGLFNTAAGIGQTVFGIFSWPFDAGKNLSAGATGILMSLPELVFFNIRKGSYKYLSYRQFIDTEKSTH
ncbi:hypothetical protein [Methylosoma difficile]